MEKKILDVTCGSRTIWFDKHHPAAIYCDKRRESMTGIWKSTNGQSERKCIIDPDIQCDFTDLPFENNSFPLVVFDPPHLRNVGENSWTYKKYGRLEENWPQMLHDGFRECMRVLKPDGVLIFKRQKTSVYTFDWIHGAPANHKKIAELKDETVGDAEIPGLMERLGIEVGGHP